MNRRSAVGRKWLALCTALLLGLMPALPLLAESAPLTQRSAAASGTVRVYLSSLSSLSSLDLTIAGSYSVNGDTTQAFTRGDQVTVSCSGGTLTLSKGGVARSMGSSFKLRRHQTSGENGVRIAQARNSANLYGGDIELRANGGKVQAIEMCIRDRPCPRECCAASPRRRAASCASRRRRRPPACPRPGADGGAGCP